MAAAALGGALALVVVGLAVRRWSRFAAALVVLGALALLATGLALLTAVP